MPHVTLTLGGGARVYDLEYIKESSRWEVRLKVWNGVEYPQSKGFHIIADTTTALCSNVYHWIGATAPYSAVCEELEHSYAVRISRYDASETAAIEEVIVDVSKLSGHGGDLFELASHAEAAATRA